MGRFIKTNPFLIKILILAVVQIVCVKLVVDHLVYGKFTDVSWRSKAGVVFFFSIAFVDMIKELVRFLSKRNGL